MNSSFSPDKWFACIVLCVAIAAATTLIHVKAVDLPNRNFQTDWHQSVIDGHAPAPDQYRILTFSVAEGLRRVTGADLIAVYAFLRFVLTVAALVVLYRYLRFWFPASLSAAGILLVGAMLPVTFFGYRMQVTDPFQFLMFALAFRALQVNSPNRLYIIAPLAAANRESAIFMIPFCIAAWYGTVPGRVVALRSVGLTLAMLSVLAPIHLLYGEHGPYSPVFTLMANLSSPRSLIFPALLFGWLSAVAFMDIKSKPAILRRFLWPTAIFVIVHLVIARIDEARLLLPLVPVVLPLALFSMGDTQSDCVKQSSFSTAQ